jgi:hypothetical protein
MKKIEIDLIGVTLLIVVSVWAVSSIIEVWRGTAHVGGCDCVVHYDKPIADGGTK